MCAYLKGTVQPKVIFYPSVALHFVNVGCGDIFSLAKKNSGQRVPTVATDPNIKN